MKKIAKYTTNRNYRDFGFEEIEDKPKNKKNKKGFLNKIKRLFKSK